MNRDNIEKYVSIIEAFDEMKKHLDSYETLATLSKEYKTSLEYEPIKSALLAIDRSQIAYLNILSTEVTKHLNSLISEDENKPLLISNVSCDKNTNGIKAGSKILTTFPKNANKDEIMKLIDKLPILEHQVIEEYKNIGERFQQFFKVINHSADNVIKFFELPGFQVTKYEWDNHNRAYCKFIIHYFDFDVNEIGYLTYSFNFINENNCKMQLERMEQKIKAGFIQLIIPKIKAI